MVSLVEDIKSVLLDVHDFSDARFSGVGVVIYNDLSHVPVCPLNCLNYAFKNQDIVASLLEISDSENPYHDGFHFISSGLTLTHVSQYFSPPIVSTVKKNHSRIIGGRYMAGIFGSCLTGVLYVGVVTKKHGVIIFENGVEIFSQNNTKRSAA